MNEPDNSTQQVENHILSQDSQFSPIVIADQNFSVLTTNETSQQFWKAAVSGRWETETIDYLTQHLRKETVVLDIGAWIGPVTLLCSRLAKNVVSFEPDPVAFSQLEKNVERNCHNVEITNAAVGKKEGILTLQSHGLGNSMTSAVGVQGEGENIIQVKMISFSSLKKHIVETDPLFVKIDIEGYEYEISDDILQLINRPHTKLLLSLHPRNLYHSLRENMSGLAARREAFQLTYKFIKKLRQLGEVTPVETASFIPIEVTAFRCVFFRRNLKNFTLAFSSKN
ncbi:MAG: FkbM family methyltransferase [Pseudomonadota bacterium]